MKPMLSNFSDALFGDQTNCLSCPRNCGADRSSRLLGYCNASDDFEVASVCVHKGEEPVIGGEHGICNVFFSNCNMQCVYCQNRQISNNRRNNLLPVYSLDHIVEKIGECLDQGCKTLGFVSPSHMIPQMLRILKALHDKGRRPVVVYNSNGYDKVETLKQLEGIIDIYLPDLKYSDPNLAQELSDTANYVDIAHLAIQEMYRQKGSPLHLDGSGQAISGLIIRHLVLPGYIENSKAVLKFIAQELSPKIHVSLMSQYHPMPEVINHPQLGRLLTQNEYDEVLCEMDYLGLQNGWVQHLESSNHFLPDFNEEYPFDNINYPASA